MKKLLYTMVFIFILLVDVMCAINTLISGYEYMSTDVVTGVTTIILSIEIAVLIVVYYKFYKLLE